MPKKIFYLKKPLDRKKALDWALVLHAMDIPYEIIREEKEYFLDVPEKFQKSADNQIRCYLRETRGHEKDESKEIPAPVSKVNPFFFIVFPLLFYVFQNLQQMFNSVRWQEAGYSSADLVLKGEWWRTVTALTLHADEGHFYSNLFIGGFIAYFLCAMAGEGLAWFLIILVGIGGNYLNAFVYQTGHNSIGFSTAVFGAIGILTGMEIARKGRRNWGKIALPLGGGLALFSLFGTDPSTDIGAHLFGLLCGIAAGILTGLVLQRFGKPKMILQIVFFLAGAAVLTVSWSMALSIK